MRKLRRIANKKMNSEKKLRNFQCVIPEMRGNAHSSARARAGPGPRSSKQPFRDQANNTQSTDSPASPGEPIALSSGDENIQAPPRKPKKHRINVNADGYADGYAEVYRKSSSFIHKGVAMHTTEFAEVQNSGETTVFRRTQTLETATELAMSEVLKHLSSVYTPGIPIVNSTAPTVKFEEDPENVARDKAYEAAAKIQMAELSREFVSISAQTQTDESVDKSIQTEPEPSLPRRDSSSTPSAASTTSSESHATESESWEFKNRAKRGRENVQPTDA